MTGPEHYREAERCLEKARLCDADQESLYLGLAQASATLALAAAVALQVTATLPPHVTEAGADWREVLKPAEQTCPGGC